VVSVFIHDANKQSTMSYRASLFSIAREDRSS
jgi:hypothetical protein